MDFITLGLLSVTAMVLALLMMPFAIKLSFKFNIVDIPDERKEHKTATPLFGGIVISLSFIISCVLFLEFNKILNAFFIGLGVITLTGLVDDIWGLRPIMKFTGEIAASLIFIFMGGVAIESFGDLIGTGTLKTGYFAIPITVFCMVGVMNALNMADGLDGLAGGLSAIGCMFLAYFALLSEQWSYLVLIAALLGSLIGFLYYNFYPARIFMGDTGSLVLGYILSAICILLVQTYHKGSLVLPISMATVLGLPIVDALLVMGKRMFDGKSPFLPDKTHLHDHLMSLNISHSKVVLVVYTAMFSCGLLALFMSNLNEWQQFALGIIYATILFGSVNILNRVGIKF